MYKLFATTIMLAVILTGCGPGHQAPGAEVVETAEDRANAAIDSALKRLEGQSSSWQAVLRELETKLTEDAQSTIRTEVDNTLRRAVGEAGTQTRCTMDFVGQRVIEELKQIRAGLTNEKVVREPMFCIAVPSAIDMNLDANRRNLITFDGYNFDSPGGIQVFVTEKQDDGTVSKDVSQHLKMVTHYQAVLNLGANGAVLTANSQEVTLKSNGRTLSTIAVIQPTLQSCRVNQVEFPIGAHKIVPPHTRGDKEFFGKIDVTLRVTLQIQEGKLVGEMYMKGEQPDDDDHTTVEGTDTWDTGFVTPQGWQLTNIQTSTEDQFTWSGDKTWEPDVFSRGNLIDRYEIVGDTATEEAGTKTSATAFFNKATLLLTEIANCKP